MLKFFILILFSILLSYVNCTCPFGYFTETSPCDTQATPLKSKKYTPSTIKAGEWAYYYISLRGIEDDIDLYFKVEGPFPEAYLNFQPDDSDKLPTDSDYYYGFHVREGVQEMPALKEINGIKNFNEAILILGLKNSGSSNTNMEITYVAEEDGDDDDDDGNRALRKLIVGIVIGVGVAGFLLFCIGGYSMWMVRRLSQRNAVGIQNPNRADVFQNKVDGDHLSLEDLQKYFPKKPFKDLENPFQQTGCSVCLEDFVPDASCHQLYCNHIFHGICVEKWLEMHNSCPGCRVPIGKKAIEEFLKKQQENISSKSIEIKIKNEPNNQ